ncbi:hypothetical protein MBM_06123 [Drepanopeziza brunnea f. sp. 'multigermtubi' MB_m1]|uniref:Uncharacterized protein n=1 Tax=Marssonina brunnea f. sp. multigermtubi (strain MB_m1) TaxID=1072389 RepID=K1WDJ4_MARBU|nr:uncharacterized protein MBM_06123 [Drepanopeziza brunnea f. sp. 'multigermtubi' MB_m1]EKD15495.1 hypothetical protein MBM_06123 [Drepanopeziza brunnea f. sp. 'multigermtubi' MB_m1]
MPCNSDYEDGEGDIEMDGFGGTGFSGGTSESQRSLGTAVLLAYPNTAALENVDDETRDMFDDDDDSKSSESSVPDDVYSSHSRDHDESNEEICDDDGSMMPEKELEESDSVSSESAEPTFVSFSELQEQKHSIYFLGKILRLSRLRCSGVKGNSRRASKRN